LFAVLTMFWAIAWCFRPWPSRRMSLAFVISCDIGIAVVALHDPTWLLGLYAFNAFAAISVYLLFFDGPKLLALHTLWILVSTTAFAVPMGAAAHLDGVAFAASTLAAVSPVVATPLGIQFGIWTLRNDANDAVTDPLTGLLNRRGLHLHFTELLRAHPARGGHLAVMVVDIDRFCSTAEIVVVPPLCPLNVSSGDFSHSARLIDRAAKSTRQWLDGGGLSVRQVPGALRPHTHQKRGAVGGMPGHSAA